MKNDFKPVVEHRFNLRETGRGRLSGPGHRAEQTLSYTWGAMGLESVVTWTLTAMERGPTCAWSNRASGRIKSRPTRAPNRLAKNSSRIWSRRWCG